jgi:rRNA maturation RNase YbeY
VRRRAGGRRVATRPAGARRGEGDPAASAEIQAGGARPPGGRARLTRDLRRVAALAAGAVGRPVDLSVALLDDGHMRRLHRERLADDTTTDVLSFPLADGREGLVGALALGVEVARREAASRGHSAYHELLLYAVHGMLHLLGHDDHAPRARARMRRAERAWLAALGVGPVFRPRRRP